MLKTKRANARAAALEQMRQRLLNAKKAVKEELDKNTKLNKQVAHLTKTEQDQSKLLATLDDDVQAIKTRLNEYEESTRAKDDQTKFSKALMKLQTNDQLTDLTMLALNVTQELERGMANSQYTGRS